MTKTITIDPVTRIEGHAKITIQLDDDGQVADARFHVVEFRGFEKFCEGRSFWEMPGITARICGICPVSHLLASAKAGDAILGVSHPAHGRQAAPAHELGADGPEPRPLLFPPERAGLAHGHGQRPGQTQRHGADRKVPGRGAQRHSPAPLRPEGDLPSWAARAFTRPGPWRAACANRSPTRTAA